MKLNYLDLLMRPVPIAGLIKEKQKPLSVHVPVVVGDGAPHGGGVGICGHVRLSEESRYGPSQMSSTIYPRSRIEDHRT